METVKLGCYAFLILVVLWAGFGLREYHRDQIVADIEDADRTQLPWRELTAPVHTHSTADAVFLYFGSYDIRHAHYSNGIPNRPVIPPEFSADDIREAMAGAPRLWVGAHQTAFQQVNLNRFRQIAQAEGYLYCETYFDHPQAELTLFVQSVALCPGPAVIATFADQMALAQVDVVQRDAVLTVYTGWSRLPAYQPDAYSIAFHLALDPSEPPVQQQDVGLSAIPAYLPLRVTFPTADAPAGTYTLTALVYDWQTGARLSVDDGDAVWPLATVTLP